MYGVQNLHALIQNPCTSGLHNLAPAFVFIFIFYHFIVLHLQLTWSKLPVISWIRDHSFWDVILTIPCPKYPSFTQLPAQLRLTFSIKPFLNITNWKQHSSWIAIIASIHLSYNTINCLSFPYLFPWGEHSFAFCKYLMKKLKQQDNSIFKYSIKKQKWKEVTNLQLVHPKGTLHLTKWASSKF